MRKLKYEQSGRRTNLRLRLDGWLARVIRRSCSNGMWTLSRDGKLVCESLDYDRCQAD